MITRIPTPSSSSPLSAIQGAWAYGNGNPNTVTTVTYAFEKFEDTSAWTSAHKAEFRAALSAIEEVANIRFVETFTPALADLYELIAPSSVIGGPFSLGYHYTPSSRPSEGAFSTDYWRPGPGGNGKPGGYFFTTLVHELGHALGLGHPHDTGLGTTIMTEVTSAFDSFGAGNLNQGVFTVMSYNDGWTQENGQLRTFTDHGGSTGLGALDVAALQALYGANTNANSANNVYIIPGSNTAGTGYKAIWDTGGVDTLQYSGSRGAIIDLRAATLDYSETGGGVVSHADGIMGGFTIANGVVIENATGGSGSDTIVGNEAVNILRGNGGDDRILSDSNGSNGNTIFAGGGHDYIRVAVGTGSDAVQGDAGNDLVDVRYNNGSFSGGTGSDTIRFASAVSTYVFLDFGTRYEFLDLVNRTTFTVFDDVEFVQFTENGPKLDFSQIAVDMAVEDIETTGTVLQYAQNGAYLLDGGSLNIAITYFGVFVTESTFGPWQAISAEAVSDGYRVLWTDGNGAYSDWKVDAQGAFESVTMISDLIAMESVQNIDLNNDGLIGNVETPVESNGSTSLSYSVSAGYLINGATQITVGENTVSPGIFGPWNAVQVEQTASGYQLLWSDGQGGFINWTLDSQAAYISHELVEDIRALETVFDVDLDGDMSIGYPRTLIENNGSTSLAEADEGYYLINDTVAITYFDIPVGPTTFGVWAAIHAEASGDGYRVLWTNGAREYSEWTLDEEGRFQSVEFLSDVVEKESFYSYDVDGSGTVGFAEPKLTRGPGAEQEETQQFAFSQSALDRAADALNDAPELYQRQLLRGLQDNSDMDRYPADSGTLTELLDLTAEDDAFWL